jgi:cob(I)alamin adenosyltransferase
MAKQGWQLSKDRIVSGDYDLIVLDEFTYTMHYGWLETESVIEWLRIHKPPELNLVISGRDAPDLLVEFADLVTVMKKTNILTNWAVKVKKGSKTNRPNHKLL